MRGTGIVSSLQMHVLVIKYAFSQVVVVVSVPANLTSFCDTHALQ